MTILLILTLLAWNNVPEIDLNTPFPQAEWDIREDPTKGIFDAVILHDITEVGDSEIIRYRKVRVLSEVGKNAAEIVDSLGIMRDIQGRVVDATGNETVFNAAADFAEVLLVANRRDEEKARIVLPPGLTNDCIVEYRWTLPAVEGMPTDGSRSSIDTSINLLFQIEYFPIQEPYFVKHKEFIMSRALTARSYAFPTRFSWSEVRSPATFETEKNRKGTFLIYRNVAPAVDYPFGNPYMDANMSRVVMFKMFSNETDKPERYWSNFSDQLVANWFSAQSKGRPFKSWIKEVEANMPQKPAAKVQYVVKAFQDKIQSTWLLPPADKHKLSELNELEKDERYVLDEMFALGVANPWNINIMFREVAKELDLPLYLVIPTSINGPVFRPESLMFTGFEFNRAFFAMQLSESQWVPICINDPVYPPGMVHPSFQAANLLACSIQEPKDVQFIRLPRLGANSHQNITNYTVQVTAEGQTMFSLQNRTKGAFNETKLNRYVSKTESERIERLRRRWERLIPEATYSNLSVEIESLPSGTVTTKVTGNLPDEDTENVGFYTINPFPGSTRPLSIPTVWPEDRTQPIILPHTFYQLDTTNLVMPPGWQLFGDNNWTRENDVGKVSFVAQQEGNMVKVRRDLILKADLMGPDKEPQLRAFLSWLDEAHLQSLAFTPAAEDAGQN